MRDVARGLTMESPLFIEVQAIDADETVPRAAGRPLLVIAAVT